MSTLSNEVMDKIDLRKKMVINLTKELGISDQKANVMLALDISGSQESRLKSGVIQETLERLIPLALKFDDNNSIDVFPFESNAFQHKNPLTMENLAGYVKKEILANYSLGGTNYAPCLQLIRNSVKGQEPQNQPASNNGGGFFSKLFGGNKTTANQAPQVDIDKKLPTYVVFLTDGQCMDEYQSRQQVIDSSKEAIFWQFVGVNDGQRFAFLESLDTMPGRYIDNANFFQVNDLNRISDEELYKKLLGEFPSWLNEARSKGLIN